MVYAFVIAEIQSCELLYSSVFEFGDTPKPKTVELQRGFVNLTVNDAPDRSGILCSDRTIAKVVQVVKNEYNFNCSVSSENVGVPAESNEIEMETRGIINVRISSLEKIVLWRACYGMLCILICDKTENRMLAARTLVYLIRSILDHIPKIVSSTSEIISKGDVVSAIVNTFLPCGQLLFLHSSSIQLLNKDLNKIINK